MASMVHFHHAQVSPTGRGSASAPVQLQGGEQVAFRVIEALSHDRYVINVKQQRVTVFSRIPLEVGGRYIAEVINRQGKIHFFFKSAVPSAIEELMLQRQHFQKT